MPIQTTKNIWHNGKLIPWQDANIHVMSHVVHYGSSIFEGIRAYTQAAASPDQPGTAGIFRLEEHMQRFRDSGHIYRMPLGYSVPDMQQAVIDLVEANGIAPCYIRPVAFRGYGEMGVNPMKSPVEVYIANYPWGKYVPGNDGANVCISSWSRNAPNTTPTIAKAGGNYLNSQLIRMEAEINGYDEGIGLDSNGLLSEGSGENLFLVRGGVLYTTPLSSSVLNGITRSSMLTLAAELGIPVVEQTLPREMLYICDEAFFTGTAAEVTHLRSVDRILIGDGTMGPITKALHDEFFGIVNGTVKDRHNLAHSSQSKSRRTRRGVRSGRRSATYAVATTRRLPVFFSYISASATSQSETGSVASSGNSANPTLIVRRASRPIGNRTDETASRSDCAMRSQSSRLARSFTITLNSSPPQRAQRI